MANAINDFSFQKQDSSPNTDFALEICNAKKNYKDVHALKGINLAVKKGEFFGLLGPNGAGKTTLIQSIVGLCRLSEGHINVYGSDVVKNYMSARQVVGYAPQEVNLDRFFSIEKILQFQAGFFGASRSEQKDIVEKLLARFNLSHKAKVQYYKLSGGMQKRVLVAKAMVGKPKLLILDEPTAGVDVEQRHELWEYLRELNKDGTTIILTTHYIDEAEILCQRIGIINLGEIRELGTPQDLILKYCRPQVKIKTNKILNSAWFQMLTGLEIKIDENTVWATGSRAGSMTEKLLSIITRQNELAVDEIMVNNGNLEDVFLSVTGDRL
jgi:ABC-2 type transport system ATP-binding protein